MARRKNTSQLNSENKVVNFNEIKTQRDRNKFILFMRDIIDAVNNPQDAGVNVFTDDDVLIVADAMIKAVYDTNDSGIVDSSSTTVIIASKATPGIINIGEIVWAIGIESVELVDNTFSTGKAIGIALTTITDIIPGRVMVLGEITGIDTSAFALGPIWVGPVPGQATQVPPVAGEKNQLVGWVLKVGVLDGVILINASDVKNTDADFSIYNPGFNIYLTALNVQAVLDQVESNLVQINQYFYGADETTTVEAAGVWTAKLQIVVAALPIGRYEWSWTAELNSSAINRQAQIKVEENAVIVNEVEIEPGDTNNWYSVGAFKQHDQIAVGPLVLEIFFKRSANPATASCRRARISIKSV
jgi:hypothetical protein